MTSLTLTKCWVVGKQGSTHSIWLKIEIRSIPTFLTELWRHNFCGYYVISDVFQKIHFPRSDFSKNRYDCSFWRYKFTEKKSDQFRHIWRRYDVIIFFRWRYFRRFWKCRNRSEFFSVSLYCQNEQSYQFLEKSDRRKCIFWKSSDTTSYPKNWWRHNSVKNVGIDLNFFRWIFTAELKVWVNF